MRPHGTPAVAFPAGLTEAERLAYETGSRPRSGLYDDLSELRGPLAKDAPGNG